MYKRSPRSYLELVRHLVDVLTISFTHRNYVMENKPVKAQRESSLRRDKSHLVNPATQPKQQPAQPITPMSAAQIQVQADWEAIDLRSRRGKAFRKGMSLEQYDLMMQELVEKAVIPER